MSGWPYRSTALILEASWFSASICPKVCRPTVSQAQNSQLKYIQITLMSIAGLNFQYLHFPPTPLYQPSEEIRYWGLWQLTWENNDDRSNTAGTFPMKPLASSKHLIRLDRKFSSWRTESVTSLQRKVPAPSAKLSDASPGGEITPGRMQWDVNSTELIPKTLVLRLIPKKNTWEKLRLGY